MGTVLKINTKGMNRDEFSLKLHIISKFMFSTHIHPGDDGQNAELTHPGILLELEKKRRQVRFSGRCSSMHPRLSSLRYIRVSLSKEESTQES